MYAQTKDSRIKMLGSTYHARFSLKGVRVQQSLNTQSFKVAVDLVNEMQNLILLGKNWKNEKHLFADLWPDFLEAKAKGKQRGKKIRQVRERTLYDYTHMGEKWFLPYFGNERVDQIDGESWETYMHHVRTNSASRGIPKLLNHWKYLSGFMSWCVAMGYVKRMPDIYNPDEKGDQDGAGKNYSDKELKDFRDGSKSYPEMYLWILMAQFMGMRSGEITQLVKDRIDLKAGLIRLKRQDTKTNKPRSIPIHPSVYTALKKQIESSDSPALFPNAIDAQRPMHVSGFKKPWTQLRSDIGVEGRFHDFRHSYATRVFANPDLNPVVVCKALGMSMQVAMDVYIHFDESQLVKITEGLALK
ncbi:Site-specific integrase [Azospirillaceae bacterium]